MNIQDGSNVFAIDRPTDPNASPGDRMTRTGAPMESFDLGDLLRKLYRRKWWIFGTIITLVLLTQIIILQLTPRYTAQSQVEVSPRQSNVVDIDTVLSGLPADTATLETEMKVLQSRKLIKRAVEKLELNRNPEFNTSLRRPSKLATWIDDMRESVREMLGRSDVSEPEEDPEELEKLRAEEEEIITSFLKNLEVIPEGRSRVITISFESQSPRMAAAAANIVADLYIVSQLEAKFEATKRANAWLAERVVNLREEVSTAERAVEAFREKSGLIRGEGEASLAAEQVSELSTQHVLERTKLSEAVARLRQVERLLTSPSGVETSGEVLASPLIRELRSEESSVERVIAELSQEFGERHPKMINARAELKDLRAKIKIEVGKIVQGLRNEVAVARARAGSLSASLESLKKQVGSLNTQEVQLRALEREAAASRSLLETLLARSKETTSQEDFQQADANVLSYAPIPKDASYPKKGMMMMIAFAASILIGLLLVFAMEQLDAGLRSSEQIERVLGVNPLGLVPTIRGLAAIGRSPETYVLDKPASAFSESIRSLHTNLLLSDANVRPKVILVTSSLPKEGKSTIAVSLARMLASIGQSVMIIDCDLRRPMAHKKLGVECIPGLVDHLAGDAALDQVIGRDRYSGAEIIPAGSSSSHPPSLLSSEAMKTLLADLRSKYDIVILDSAPVMAVSDSLVLSRMADKTVYIVRWRDTRRETAASGMRQILEAGGDAAGALLTMVNVKEHAQYGFGDSGSYSGQVRKYYTG